MSMERIPGLDAWITRDPREDESHHPKCPQHEDQPQAFECGGIEEHFCSLIEREINGCEIVETDCKCDELDAADECDRADARRDAERDR